MNDISTSPQGALITACALGALMLALILWRTSMSARARASERARIWGELKRPELEARAQRKADERASGARMSARIRGALMLAVALVALGATNLSAHGTLDDDSARRAAIARRGNLRDRGLRDVPGDPRRALALAHEPRHRFNKYETGVWTMAALMGGMSWWGAGSADLRPVAHPGGRCVAHGHHLRARD